MLGSLFRPWGVGQLSPGVGLLGPMRFEGRSPDKQSGGLREGGFQLSVRKKKALILGSTLWLSDAGRLRKGEVAAMLQMLKEPTTESDKLYCSWFSCVCSFFAGASKHL